MPWISSANDGWICESCNRVAPARTAPKKIPATAVPAAEPDWKAVEQALGKPGQLQGSDVFRVGMPRADLAVTVKGVPVKPGFALGSYAAFKQMGDQAMVMGDLVLLDQEIPAVMSGLFSRGLEVTAIHNHLNEMSPHAESYCRLLILSFASCS